jgi:Ca2+-binding RTX toxin-like protein
MSRITFNQWSKKLIGNRRNTRKTRKRSRTLAFEHLGERVVLSVTASFDPTAGVLSVFGDHRDNNIVVSRDVAGHILINGGDVAVRGGTATVANTTLVQVFGRAGNDQISLDEANGALPAAKLYGGSGNDVLTGGSANDILYGDAGNDTLLGKGGNDQLFGGAGNDTLTGGTGNDSVFGEAGNDRMIWNNGDNTDLNEGGTGNDTVEVNGANAGDQFTIAANGSRVRFDRLNLIPFSLDIGTTENLVVNGLGGDDAITAGNGLADLIHLTLDGGDGNDRIAGGDGNDTIIGGRGNDELFGGAGDDTFIWNPGGGSDVVEGQRGVDTLQFNGANVDETFDLSANGNRLRLFRNVGNVTMDVGGVEQVNVAALGGADTITVNDLTGSGVTDVSIDLAGTLGRRTGDGAADTVIVNGTDGHDAISIGGHKGDVDVLGLAAQVHIAGADADIDRLTVSALGGDDMVNASRLHADTILLTEDGGDGNDVLIGGAGNDTLLGGAGDDLLIGGRGQDTLDGGPGNNSLVQ